MRTANDASAGGDVATAEMLFLKAYDQGVALFGVNHGSVGLVLMRLSQLSRRTGKLVLAAAYEEEAERIADVYLFDAE